MMIRDLHLQEIVFLSLKYKRGSYNRKNQVKRGTKLHASYQASLLIERKVTGAQLLKRLLFSRTVN